MASSTAEVMNRGMRCLRDAMGIVEAEQFISIIIREKFDYTNWRRQYFDQKSIEEIDKEMEEYCTSHPYEGDPVTVI